jgi:hypothetical protein
MAGSLLGEPMDVHDSEPSPSKREPLEGGVRIFELLEPQHGELGEPQLAGEEQADRASSRDDHVVDHRAGASVATPPRSGTHLPPLMDQKLPEAVLDCER